jgi:glycosyltransferase involved in cell wall biosynthesis
MAVGTPVIASRLGAPAELIEDDVNGALISPGDAKALAQILSRLAADTGIVDRWRAALPPVRSLDDVAADYLRLYAAGDRA